MELPLGKQGSGLPTDAQNELTVLKETASEGSDHDDSSDDADLEAKIDN